MRKREMTKKERKKDRESKIERMRPTNRKRIKNLTILVNFVFKKIESVDKNFLSSLITNKPCHPLIRNFTFPEN